MKLGKLQRKWVNYLKKHPEQQTGGSLGYKNSGEVKMCCLGAAGLIIGSCEFEKGLLVEIESDNSYYLAKSYSEIGLISDIGDVKNEDSLANLNDDGVHTWTDIAYLIEAAPELFFTKSV